MEDRRRANITEHNRNFIKSNEDKLGFGDAATKDIYALTIALGADAPKELKGKVTSWIRAETIDTNTTALMAAARLGADDVTDENINQFADYNTCVAFADQCANAGFEKLEQMIEEADGENDTLIAELMNELDNLYKSNVKPEENLSIC